MVDGRKEGEEDLGLRSGSRGESPGLDRQAAASAGTMRGEAGLPRRVPQLEALWPLEGVLSPLSR